MVEQQRHEAGEGFFDKNRKGAIHQYIKQMPAAGDKRSLRETLCPKIVQEKTQYPGKKTEKQR